MQTTFSHDRGLYFVLHRNAKAQQRELAEASGPNAAPVGDVPQNAAPAPGARKANLGTRLLALAGALIGR